MSDKQGQAVPAFTNCKDIDSKDSGKSLIFTPRPPKGPFSGPKTETGSHFPERRFARVLMAVHSWKIKSSMLEHSNTEHASACRNENAVMPPEDARVSRENMGTL